MNIEDCVVIKFGHREYIVEREKALKAFDVLSRLDLSYCFDSYWDSELKESKPYIKFDPFEVSIHALNKSEYTIASMHPKSDPIV